MITPRPPSRPSKHRKKGRKHYYGIYSQDKLDDQGNIVGRHQVQVPLFDEGGQRITTPRKADQACEALYEHIQAQWSGAISPNRNLAGYRDTYVGSRSRRSGTSRSYGAKLGQFLGFLKDEYGVEAFRGVERPMVKAFLDRRQDEVRLVTVYGDLRAIKAFFNEAVRDRQIAENPCKGIKLPPLRGAQISEGFFLPAEMDAIVAHVREHDPVWYGIFAGFRYAPFRRDELSYLEWTDVDLTRDTIRIQDAKPAYGWHPKRGGRTMDLHPTLKGILEGLGQSGTFVYDHPDQAVFSDPVIERRELGRKSWRKVKTVCRTLDLAASDETGSWQRRFPNGPHLKAFRSGISCELQLKGAPLAYVQELLGHHDQTLTLQHYTHLVPDLVGSLTKRFIGYLGG